MGLINNSFFRNKKKKPIGINQEIHPNHTSLLNLLSLGQSSRKAEEIKGQIVQFTFNSSVKENELQWLYFYFKVEKYLIINDGKYIGTPQVLRNHLLSISDNFKVSDAFNALIGNQECQQIKITQYFIKYFLHNLDTQTDFSTYFKSLGNSVLLNQVILKDLDKVSFIHTSRKLKDKLTDICTEATTTISEEKLNSIYNSTLSTFKTNLHGIEKLDFLRDLKINSIPIVPSIVEKQNSPQPIKNGKKINGTLPATPLSYQANSSSNILENILDAYILIDRQGAILDINSNTKKLFGYPEDILKQKNISDLLPKDFLNHLKEDLNTNSHFHVHKILGNRREIELETISETKDIEVTVTNNYSSPVDTFTVLLKDLSHKKETLKIIKEAKFNAEKSAQAKSTFLSNMSHEIRTPLNVILGLSDIINSDSNIDPETIKQNIQGIDFSAKSLLSIVNDILDFSKIEAGKLTIQSLDFNLKKIISGISNGFKIKANEKGLEYFSVLSDDIPDIVIGDQYRLNQILTNLIGNAIKFTNEGQVSLNINTLAETDENVSLEFKVIDTGIGIQEKQLHRIFESFYQIEKAENSVVQGTGLGLAITKQLIELLGGTLKAHSTGGNGSTFAFVLTFEKSSLKSLEVHNNVLNKQDEQLAGLNILVAEDNKMNQFYIKQLLKNLKINTVIAENGQEALDIYLDDTQKFDLILMDMHMPIMNGIEAIKNIRNSAKNKLNKVPIVICSADVFPDTRKNAVKAGIDFYLTKPLSLEALKEVLFWLVNDNFSDKKSTTKLSESKSNKIDIEHLNRTFDHDQEFITDLLKVFITETPQDFNTLRDCISKGYYPRVKEIAHKMKSSFMNLGMTDQGHHLQQIEKNILYSEHEKMALEHFDQFKKLYSKTLLEANLLILDIKKKQSVSA